LVLCFFTGLVPEPPGQVAQNRKVLGPQHQNGGVRSLRGDGAALAAPAGNNYKVGQGGRVGGSLAAGHAQEVPGGRRAAEERRERPRDPNLGRHEHQLLRRQHPQLPDLKLLDLTAALRRTPTGGGFRRGQGAPPPPQGPPPRPRRGGASARAALAESQAGAGPPRTKMKHVHRRVVLRTTVNIQDSKHIRLNAMNVF